jgi:predicted lipoprotein
MNKMTKYISFLVLLIITASSCEKTSTTEKRDNFDRNAIVTKWIDELIVPGYTKFVTSLTELKLAHVEFTVDPSNENLENLREHYVLAYLNWQSVSMFEIGEAERLNLRSFTNLYPTDTTLIQDHLKSGTYNLELPSTFTAQGFPALDYLLFAEVEQSVFLTQLQDEEYERYITTVIDRLIDLATKVKNSWNADYRAEFLADRTSIDRLVNDYLFYFEKFLRAGKVGIPAGVFSGSPLSGNVEAPYSAVYSKKFLLKSLEAVIDFFNGNSLDIYLSFMGREDITTALNLHWNNAMQKINSLDASLVNQVETDHIALLEVYDDLQKAVILLKVDMLQALNIQVDYVDADGD